MASQPKRAPNFQALHSIIIFVFVIITILIPFVSSSDSAVAPASPATNTVAKQSEAVALLKWKASLDNQTQSPFHHGMKAVIALGSELVATMPVKNSLFGSIPQEVGLLRSLIDLELSKNNLTGSIPASIGNLTNLKTLYLYENSLSGSIPQEVGLLRSLTDLELAKTISRDQSPLH
ncbi:hypothetical protein RHSIM_RhsimUnG0062400 [Rhododendron simsii]|uniref:Uncharacterized protein n=1 Tax=Rhododendron simsii TaxID=118357 RepID=A0A834FX20_RHOSS|nr:hypothetical protein RHSIM_RhsimUnG0062400 [Rhododendron simsii]